MSQAKERRPGVGTEAAEKSTKGDGLDRQSTGSRSAVARCDAFEPAGNRRRWLVVVARCPHCSGTHQHYGDSIPELLTAFKAGCGRPYRLRLTRLFHAGGVRGGR